LAPAALEDEGAWLCTPLPCLYTSGASMPISPSIK
jgi:hypothetical protein